MVVVPNYDQVQIHCKLVIEDCKKGAYNYANIVHTRLRIHIFFSNGINWINSSCAIYCDEVLQ